MTGYRKCNGEKNKWQNNENKKLNRKKQQQQQGALNGKEEKKNNANKQLIVKWLISTYSIKIVHTASIILPKNPYYFLLHRSWHFFSSIISLTQFSPLLHRLFSLFMTHKSINHAFPFALGRKAQ